MNPDLFLHPSFLLAMANTVGMVVLWLRRPGQDAQKSVDQAKALLVAAHDALKGRIDVLEERIRHMPTSDELTALEGTVGAMNSTLAGMREGQESLRRTLTRIEDFLMRKS